MWVEYRELIDDKGVVYKERWPFINEIKAISPSSLTKPLMNIVYGINKTGFVNQGMKDGQDFEHAVALYLNTEDLKFSIGFISNDKLHERFEKLIREIEKDFPFEDKDITRHDISFWNYKGRINFACETDITIDKECILEIKKTNTSKLSPLKKRALLLAYELQMYIQFKATGLHIHACWASDEFIVNNWMNEKFLEQEEFYEWAIRTLLRYNVLEEEDQVKIWKELLEREENKEKLKWEMN